MNAWRRAVFAGLVGLAAWAGFGAAAETAAPAPVSAALAGWSVCEILSGLALAVALVLFAWTGRRLRRFSGGAAGRELELVDRMAAGPRTTLMLVRLRGRDYWLVDHVRGGATMFEVTPSADETPAPESAAAPPPEDTAPIRISLEDLGGVEKELDRR